jgi:diguanylate cyclase (GGDEF)-like protein
VPRPRGRVAVGFALALTAVAVIATCLLLGARGRVIDAVLFDGVYSVGLFLAGGLCFARARVHAAERWAWRMFGLAMFAWLVGGLLYSRVVSRMDPVPYPSIVDAIYLSFFPLMFTGLVLLLRARVSRFHASVWLDGLVGMLAIAAFGAAAVFNPVLHATDGTAAAVATNLAYPLGDLMLLGFVAGLFSLSGWRPGRALSVIALALVIQVGTDAFYLFQTASGTYQWGGWLNLGWLVFAVMLAVAAWQPDAHPRPLRFEGVAAVATPVGFALVALAVLVASSFVAGVSDVAAVLATAGIFAAVGRLLATLRESRRLDAMARRDPLTGLLNRGEFADAVDDQVDAGLREGAPFSVLLLDVDGFKEINDLRGHAEGDRVLRELATALRECSRPSDLACRIGGDEFALVLPNATAQIAAQVGERVRDRLARLDDGVGVSFGVAEWPDDGPAGDAVVLRADVALYAAKRDSAETPADEEASETSRDLERAQLRAYAADVRASYARELLRTRELHASYLATVQTLAAAVEAKDDYTGGHIHRVHELGMLLARALAPDDADDPQLAYGFLLHDIGKLAVPDDVLTKPGKLSEREWDLMKTHPEAGARILEKIPFLDRALDVVLHHHERWDGAGYPHGLAGEAIPLWARIFAVVDAVDAITSDRPYRRGRPLSVAVEQVLEGSGAQFDPRCAEAFAGLDVVAVEALLEHRPDTGLRSPAGEASPALAGREG